ncbi:unnamed protein product [Cunninghamella echinulata]
MSKKKNNTVLPTFKPKSNSIYLAIIVFDKEQNVLLTPNQQYPILPILTRDCLAYHNFTINNPDFHFILQYCQQQENQCYETDFLKKFINTHHKLLQLIGCSHQHGVLYRHILEFQRPNFKLLFMLYPFEQLTIISPLSRTSRLYWYPSHNQDHLDFITKYELVTSPSNLTMKLWRQPRAIYHSLCSQLPRGLYLALFYCQSSPSNCRRGLQIYLEKHHEHRLPCVPLRYDTSITANEWEWLQTCGRKQQHQEDISFLDNDNNMDNINKKNHNDHDNSITLDINLNENQYPISPHHMDYLETYDFLTKEMQEKQQLEQQKIQQQLIPFQHAIQNGCHELESLTGINIQLEDLFTEDSLCFIYDQQQEDNMMEDKNNYMDPFYNDDHIEDQEDDDDDDDDDDSLDILQKTLKRKTLSIADMFTYGQKQIQQSWSKPVHTRLLIIVKPLCLTPDFPVRSNFDFYPYRLFKSLYQDKLQFATASSSSSSSGSLIPRRKPQHHVSMSDLLNSTIKNSTLMFSNRPHYFIQQHTIHNNNDYDLNPQYDPLNNSSNIDCDSNDVNNNINEMNTSSIISYQIKYTPQHDKSTTIIDQKKRTNMSYNNNNEMDFSMAILYHENDLKGWTGRLLEFDRQRMASQSIQQQQLKSISDTSTVTTNASVPIMTTTTTNIRSKHQRNHRLNSTCSLPIDFTRPHLSKTNTIPFQQKHHHQQQCNYLFESDTKSLSKWVKQWWVAYRKK